MRNYSPLTALITTALLHGCSSDSQPTSYLQVDDRVVIEVETWSDSTHTGDLRWSVTDDLNGVVSAAPVANSAGETTAAFAGPVASVPGTAVTTTASHGTPTLSYELNFTDPGTYHLWLRGKKIGLQQASAEISFSNDAGDTSYTLSRFANHWHWQQTDELSQAISFSIESSGPYQLEVSSVSTGLLLDKLILTQQSDFIPQGHGPVSTLSGGADAFSLADTDTVSLPPTQTTGVVRDDVPQSTDADTEIAELDHSNVVLVLSAPVAPVNTPPVITAIPAVVTHVNTPTPLSASATDDGLPGNGVYYYWSKLNGPGSIEFSPQNQSNSSALFSHSGSYTLQLNASDGKLYSNLTFSVTVEEAPKGTAVTPTPTPGYNTTAADSVTGHTPTNDKSALFSGNLNNRWQTVTSAGKPTPRHETGGVVVNGKLYVIGGRRTLPVDVYDPKHNRWTSLGKTPFEMHHFQPVAIGSKIYIVGGFTCCYPVEKAISHVQIFDTKTGKWTKGASIPAKRRRGSAGAAAHNGKIYLLGGNTNGHSGGAVNWFDEFDPESGKWKKLANAPDARDHVSIAIAGDKLVAAGGRKSTQPNPFTNTVASTNVYDFKKQKWQRTSAIPTQRAGAMTVAAGNEIIVMGGESDSQNRAHRDVEAYNIATRKWRLLRPMNTGRHSGTAALLDGRIHIVVGATSKGGAGETSSHERLK